MIEVHSTQVPINSTQTPTYTAIHRIEIEEQVHSTMIIISFKIDYKKTVFQESKVDKRVGDRVKKFYLDELTQLEKGLLKLKKSKNKQEEQDDLDHKQMQLRHVVVQFIVSLNIDVVVMVLLVLLILTNIVLMTRFILNALSFK